MLQVRNKIISLARCSLVLALTGIVGIGGPAIAAQLPEVAALSTRFARHQNFDPRQSAQERTCTTCHTGVVEASHPTGFIPRRPLPPQFLLNERGEMTCSTCHAIENAGEIRMQAGQSNQEFCESCHSASFFSRMRDSGDSILLSGHISVDRTEAPSGIPDRYSKQCMTCHMDNATIAGTRSASIGFISIGGSTNHSIGSSYSNFSMRRGYQPEASLAAEILLPEGKVSCLSCHKAYTQKHGEITVTRDLCMQCHIK